MPRFIFITGNFSLSDAFNTSRPGSGILKFDDVYKSLTANDAVAVSTEGVSVCSTPRNYPVRTAALRMKLNPPATEVLEVLEVKRCCPTCRI